MSLFEDVVFYLGRKRAVARLRAESGGSDDEAVRVGVVLSLPVVIANLARWIGRQDHADWLGERVATVPPALAGDLDALLASDGMTELGNDVLDLVLGEDAPRIVDLLAKRAQIDDDVAAPLLSITAAALVAHLATRYRTVPSTETLRGDLESENRGLASGGWDPWVAETMAAPATLVPLDAWQRERDFDLDPGGHATDDLADRAGHAADDLAGGAAAAVRSADPLDERELSAIGYPPPRLTDRPPGRPADSPGVGLHRDQHDLGLAVGDQSMAQRSRLEGGPVGPHAATVAPARATSADLDWEGGNWFSRRRGLVILLGGLAVVLGLLAFALLQGGDEDPANEIATGDDPAAPTTAATEDEATPTSTGDTEASTGSTAPAVEGPQTLVVPMVDPLGITDGTGTAVLDLDPDSGEICYEFAIDGIESPYDGHIHVGPVGVKGGIVVDFGLLNGPTSGCIDNSPAGTQAILADLGGHYAEFHDADGIATIRAQLAEPAAGEPVDEVADQDPDGAYARIEPGRLVLTGNVPNQVTIDKYLETFADLDPDSIEIVNELVIVPGSPRPSGRILVDETVFFDFDSADLVDAESTVLQDLATIFKARPAWRMTVVGHTDSLGTDVYNLELSLRRANAVRDALIQLGVSADALTVEGAGATAPIGPNDTEAGRSQNRRIELEVTPG